MPTINIPARARLILYLAAAIALLVVGYLVDKDWAGDAEVRLVTGLAALLNLLTAAKTDLNEPTTQAELVAQYRGRVAVVEDSQGRHEADERGAAQLPPVLLATTVLLLALLGWLLIGLLFRGGYLLLI